VIKIDAKRKFIPVEIGTNKFEFDLSDNAVLKLKSTLNKVVERIERINISDDLPEEKRLELTKQAQRESFDYLLGKGAYDKVYKEVCNISAMTDILIELEEQLPAEIEAATQSEKLKKYIGE
jgi:hypothetical protein